MQIKLTDVSADIRLGPIKSPDVLKNVNLHIPAGKFTAIVGHTGAGKSSLLKALNGLLLPRNGKVSLGEQLIIDNNADKKILKSARQKVGMVFQFPENQLFAETVEKDICFGPLNLGVPMERAKEIAADVITQVGLDPSFLKRSPFSLSGGQKRRVALAGVLAMNPEILVLDEPGAGLDPNGRKEILELLKIWSTGRQRTIVMVTHDMEDVAKYAEYAVVMEKGTAVYQGDVQNLFADKNRLENWNLELPIARKFQLQLEEKLNIKFNNICLTEEDLADALIEVGLV